MANTEETSNTDIIFRGIDGNECEEFIIAIRDLAFAKGKEDDSYWMLHYATTRLRGKALRWHAKLDPSARKNWDLFVESLLESYPFVEEEDQAGITTPIWTSTSMRSTPSTTLLPGNKELCCVADVDPQVQSTENAVHSFKNSERFNSCACVPGTQFFPSSRVYNPSAPGPHLGRLRVVYDQGETWPKYVRCCIGTTGEDVKNVTASVDEALIVSFVPLSQPHEILCMNPRRSHARKLAIKLFRSDRWKYHPIIGGWEHRIPVTVTSTNPDDEIVFCQRVSNVWNVLADGTLQASLTDLMLEATEPTTVKPSGAYLTTTVYVDISGMEILFTKDHNTPPILHLDLRTPLVRARVVFEPL